MSDKVNILLVDDRPEKLLALEALLLDLGQNLVHATSGRDALRRVLADRFAVILLDINMPGMDGFETAELIRQHKDFRHTPIIFLTASGDEVYGRRCYSLGAVDYIQTPFVPEILKTKVKVFVEMAKKSRQVELQAEALRRRAGQLHELARASLAIHSARPIEPLLRAISRSVRDVLGAPLVVTTASIENGPPRVATSAADEAAEAQAASSSMRRAADLVQERRAPLRLGRRVLQDLLGSARGEPDAPAAVLAAPLLQPDGRAFGAIVVAYKEPGGPTADDEALLQQLAQVGSVAIENCLFAGVREASRIKDEFLATLSHELRNPLSAIAGWTHMLRAGSGAPAQLARGLEVIDRNVQAQLKLIEDLLDASRIASGKLGIQPRPLRLRPLVEAALETVRAAAEAKRITIVTAFDPTCDPDVSGDPDRLLQVAANLLSNAVKFTPAGGHVEVGIERVRRPEPADRACQGAPAERAGPEPHGDRLRRSPSVDRARSDQSGTRRRWETAGERVGDAEAPGQDRAVSEIALWVRDDGEGIDPEFLPFVFDRFRQADSSSKKAHAGLGLGLAIVRHIVELHGGSVRAESSGRSRGSLFWVRLPELVSPVALRQPTSDSPSSATAARAGAAIRGVRVLLVEDEPDAREMMTELLTSRGALVAAVGSVREALEVYPEFRPTVVVSDIGMPGEDGYALIRALRNRSKEDGAEVPAIALTAYARADDHALALAAGFQRHAPKPIDPDELVAAVAELAGMPFARPASLQDAESG